MNRIVKGRDSQYYKVMTLEKCTVKVIFTCAFYLI